MRKLNFKLFVILGISLAMVASVFTACEKEEIGEESKTNNTTNTVPSSPNETGVPEEIALEDITDAMCDLRTNQIPYITPQAFEYINYEEFLESGYHPGGYVIINSQEELQEWCPNAPTLNFNEGSLLLTFYILPGAIPYDYLDSVDFKLIKNSELDYTFYANFVTHNNSEFYHYSFFWVSEGINSDASISHRIKDQVHHIQLTDVTPDIPCSLYSNDSVIIINSNAELQALCPNAPTYDFSNASIIICSGTAPNEISKIEGWNGKGLYEYMFSEYHLDFNVYLLNEIPQSTNWYRCYLTGIKINPDFPIYPEYYLISE